MKLAMSAIAQASVTEECRDNFIYCLPGSFAFDIRPILRINEPAVVEKKWYTSKDEEQCDRENQLRKNRYKFESQIKSYGCPRHNEI